MKRILVIIVLFILHTAQAQVLDSIKMTNKGFMPLNVTVENKNKEEIYSKIKSWINRTFKEPAFVIKADEKDSYIRIAANSSFSFKYMGTTTYDYDYNAEIEIKDGSWSYRIFDITMYKQRIPEYFYDTKGRLKTGKMYSKIRYAFLDDINRIYFSLNDFLNK